MSRLSTALLVAYATSMTLVAVWFGCQSYIVRRLLSFTMGISRDSRLTYREIIDRCGGPRFLVDPISVGAMYFGSIEPSSIAVISVVILFGCLGLCSLQRSRKGPEATTIKKD